MKHWEEGKVCRKKYYLEGGDFFRRNRKATLPDELRGNIFAGWLAD